MKTKKLLNISVIAALAILPLAANAKDLTSEQLAYADPATDDGKTVATAKYVKGAYNELGTAINTKQDKLTDEQLKAVDSGITSEKVTSYDKLVTTSANFITKDVNDLTNYTTTADMNEALDAKADASTTYTKTEVDSALAKKADAETTYTKTEVNTELAKKQDSLTDKQLAAVESGITADKVESYDNLVEKSKNYATKDGVTATIKASNVTVPVLTTWGNNTATNIGASIVAAAYTEPAPAVEQ